MPWKETCAVDQRMRFVIDYQDGRLSLSELCGLYGISRQCAYKWLRRYEAEGIEALVDRSRRPRGNSRAVGASVEELVVAARSTHPQWGPRKLRAWLGAQHPELQLPAASTIGEILKRRGLVRPRRKRRPSGALPGAGGTSGGLWCADFKGHFKLGEGARCHPLTITDHDSRYLIACTALERESFEGARRVFEAAFREHGLPPAIRTDNGTPFAGNGVGALSRLSVWWLKLGIALERTRPGKPQDNGRHERMHRTLKAETTRPPERDLPRQQERFDTFRDYYNRERPHQALGYDTPAARYRPAQREYPRHLSDPVYPGHFELRRVRRGATIKWRGSELYLSQALAGETVGLEQRAGGLWLIHFAACPLALLDEENMQIRPLPARLKVSTMSPV